MKHDNKKHVPRHTDLVEQPIAAEAVVEFEGKLGIDPGYQRMVDSARALGEEFAGGMSESPPVAPSEMPTPRPMVVAPPAVAKPKPEHHMTEVTTNQGGSSFLSCRAGCGIMSIAGPQDSAEDRAQLDTLAFRSRGQRVQHGPGHA